MNMHLMATNPSSKSDDGTNEDDDANARDAGGADKDRVGGTGGGTMPLAGRYDVFFLECGENSTIKSTVVRDDDGATDDDVTNDDDEANAGDAGGADKDRVGGTGGGTMHLAGHDDVFYFGVRRKLNNQIDRRSRR